MSLTQRIDRYLDAILTGIVLGFMLAVPLVALLAKEQQAMLDALPEQKREEVLRYLLSLDECGLGDTVEILSKGVVRKYVVTDRRAGSVTLKSEDGGTTLRLGKSTEAGILFCLGKSVAFERNGILLVQDYGRRN
jgi:hypothetical protein